MSLVLMLTGMGTACSQHIEDPVFDYNLKSARVIETNNDFGITLLNKVIEQDKSPNLMIFLHR